MKSLLFFALWFLPSLNAAESYTLKDRNGVPIISIYDVKFSPYTSMFNGEVTDFECNAKNLTSFTLKGIPVVATANRRNAPPVRFNLLIAEFGEFTSGAYEGCSAMLLDVPYPSGGFESIEFSIAPSWHSLAAWKAKAAMQAKADATRRAEEAAAAKALAARCAQIYKATIDKRLADLTMRETQQVNACRSQRLYPPPQ